MHLNNVGSGAAFSAYIDDIFIKFLDVKDRWRIKFIVKPDHVLAKQSEPIKVEATNVHGQAVKSMDFIHYMIRFRGTNKPLPLNIYFRDVSGKRYVTKVETGNGVIKVVKPSANYNIRRFIKYRVYNPAATKYSQLFNHARRLYEIRYHPTFFTKLAKEAQAKEKADKNK